MKLRNLFRPSGMLTALADTWAGFTISGTLVFSFQGIHSNIEGYKLFCLSVGGMLLYLGGITLNGFFNKSFIIRSAAGAPSDKIGRMRFRALGFGLFLIGSAIALDFTVGKTSGGISILVAFISILYNVYGRHNAYMGPLLIGLCRGGIVVLGISLAPEKRASDFMVILLPIIFFAAGAVIRKSRETSMYRNALQLSGWMYFALICLLLAIALVNSWFLNTLPFAALLFYTVFRPLTQAFKDPAPANLRKVINWTYLSIILLDACIAASFAGVVPALIILSLMPVTWLFAMAEWGSQAQPGRQALASDNITS